jgi:Mg-chelatase subunit ChlD
VVSGPGPDGERARRWRLLLGADAEEGLGSGLGAGDAKVDQALTVLYDRPDADSTGSGRAGRRSGGLGGSAPAVARWLGDIRTYFPSTVVQVMQRDAVDRLGLHRMLLEPELLAAVEPDVHLASTLLSLNRVMPETTRATARKVVAQVVAAIEKRIAQHTRSAVSGALDRAGRTRRPRQSDIDWGATIAANLTRYLPEHRTVVPERLVGHTRRRQSLEREVVLAIDQSGSMASSVVYAAVFGAVLATIRSLRTSLVVFDTAVVDLSDRLDDPVDLLFGTQLGGGTDINKAVAYCASRITKPRDTLFVLVTDLFEGGNEEEMLRRIAHLHAAGVQVLVLLALSDDGAPVSDKENAAALASLGIPVFACTPDAFPELLAVALRRGDVEGWVQQHLHRQAATHRSP